MHAAAAEMRKPHALKTVHLSQPPARLPAVHEAVDGGAQAFINTARKIYEKIEQGIFDVSNEVRADPTHVSQLAGCPLWECRERWRVSVSWRLGMSEVFSGLSATRCERAVWCAVIWDQGGLRSGRAGRKHSAPWRGRPRKEQLLLLKQQRGTC